MSSLAGMTNLAMSLAFQNLLFDFIHQTRFLIRIMMNNLCLGVVVGLLLSSHDNNT